MAHVRDDRDVDGRGREDPHARDVQGAVEVGRGAEDPEVDRLGRPASTRPPACPTSAAGPGGCSPSRSPRAARPAPRRTPRPASRAATAPPRAAGVAPAGSGVSDVMARRLVQVLDEQVAPGTPVVIDGRQDHAVYFLHHTLGAWSPEGVIVLRFSGAGVSDVGRVRPHNEDSGFVGSLRRGRRRRRRRRGRGRGRLGHRGVRRQRGRARPLRPDARSRSSPRRTPPRRRASGWACSATSSGSAWRPR